MLQGIPDLNAFPGEAGKTATDTIKINLGTPPSSSPNRLGVLADDTAGYPNGRRLTDDVVDIDLQVVAGALQGNEVPLGDGVNQNDVEFLTEFPYLAAPGPGANPDAGYGSKLKALAEVGSDNPVPVAGEDEDDGGTSAAVWILLGVGALALIGVAYAVGRRAATA